MVKARRRPGADPALPVYPFPQPPNRGLPTGILFHLTNPQSTRAEGAVMSKDHIDAYGGVNTETTPLGPQANPVLLSERATFPSWPPESSLAMAAGSSSKGNTQSTGGRVALPEAIRASSS